MGVVHTCPHSLTHANTNEIVSEKRKKINREIDGRFILEVEDRTVDIDAKARN